MTPANRIDKLRQEIRRHDHLYFVENAPVITDQDYDALMRELIDLEKAHPDLATPDSPTHRVGGAPIDSFSSIEHVVPMMSIDNTYDEAEVRKFDERVRKLLGGEIPRYVMEEKVDGISASLRYENGVLVTAATRGDGKRGDDITANVRTIAAIPLVVRDVKKAPAIMEIRGEIYMTNAEFLRLNTAREEAELDTFANPRNATGGTLKQLNPRAVAERHLRFIAHGVGLVDPMPVTCYWDWIQMIRELGLPSALHARRVDTIDEVIAEIEEFAKVRQTLPFLTDGMVVKVDDFSQRAKLGTTTKAPRWVIAYKYQPDRLETKLRGLTWQVGRLGTLTPVAELEPVEVAGSTVQRASLHNIDQNQRMDIRIGDHVIVEKAGEVIPQVVRVVLEKRPVDARQIELPRICPNCGAKTEKPGHRPDILCINPACPAQLRGRLRAFCARGQMNIEHLGEALIDQLVEHKLVKTYADIYLLKKEDLLGLELMADKSAQNVIDSIAASRDRSLDRVLAGLSIPLVGNRAALSLATHYGSFDAIAKAKKKNVVHTLMESQVKGAQTNTSGVEESGVIINAASSLLAAISAPQFEAITRLNTDSVGRRTPDCEAVRHAIDLLRDGLGPFIEREMQRSLGDKWRKEVEQAFRKSRAKFESDLNGVGFLVWTLANKKWAQVFGKLLGTFEIGLSDVDGIGEEIAESVYDFFHNPSGLEAVDALKSVGIDPRFDTPSSDVISPLFGQKIVVTGTLKRYSRPEIEEMIQKLGGRVTGSVSKETSFVLAGDDAGSKLDKANELNLTVLNEDQFDAIISAKASDQRRAAGSRAGSDADGIPGLF